MEKVAVNMVESDRSARIAKDRVSVSMTDCVICVRIVVEKDSVNMTEFALDARIAEERVSVSMVACALTVSIAKERAFVNKFSSPTIAVHLLTRVLMLTRPTVLLLQGLRRMKNR